MSPPLPVSSDVPCFHCPISLSSQFEIKPCFYLDSRDSQVCLGQRGGHFGLENISLLVCCFFPEANTHTHFVCRRVFPVGFLPRHTQTRSHTGSGSLFSGL